MKNTRSGTPVDTRRVVVELGERRYPILIGSNLLGSLARHLVRAVPGARCAIVTDESVAELHLDDVRKVLAAEKLLAGEIVLAPGETSKSFEHLDRLCQQLLEMGIERGDAVVALGGGVVGDLAGFAASILRRGVRIVHVPTTLLAQVDSSIGGKTGVNTPQGKNLIGAFHQPSLVVADIDTLRTLPPREFRAGYAEIVKYGLLGHASFFNWLETARSQIFALEREALVRAIETSCRNKAAIVEVDEREAETRALLNLGHTFGHAMEGATGYSNRLIHGEAVAIGMCLAFAFSAELELCRESDAQRVKAHLRAAGLPTSISDIPGERPKAETLLNLMGQDKKVRQGRMRFVLARGIGDAFVTHEVPPDRLARFMKRQVA